jgi:uracil-DNA glycosylase
MADDQRAAELAEIAAQVQVCKLCRLHESATKGVPGAGNMNAEIMFIGEGPGYHEDRQGLPFVGPSGKYLEKMLALIGLKREDVFITNVVKHRPPENRDPLPDEIAACSGYLERQIAIIDPLVIATLGRFSMARYFPDGKITKIHGVPKYDEANGRAYYPFFHPAAVLRNDRLAPDMEADFKRLLDILAKVKEMRAKGTPPASVVPPSGNGGGGGKPSEPEGPSKQLTLF